MKDKSKLIMDMELKPLRQILRAASSKLPTGWLCLPEAERKWTLDTHGFIHDWGDAVVKEDLTESGELRWIAEKGFMSTLDSDTIEDIACNAKDLGAPVTDELLFEAFMYYYDYDAFLPSIGACDPTFRDKPREELQLECDRNYYDSLGEERHDVQCAKDDCRRGALPLRIFCKVHHFEMMKSRPCPFGKGQSL